MLPWILASAPWLGVEPNRTKVDVISEHRNVSIETLEVTHTTGHHAKSGDRVTVHYKLIVGRQTIVDSEKQGVPYTFVLEQESLPTGFYQSVFGLQKNARRKTKFDYKMLGSTFNDRWPQINGSVVLEVKVLELDRPPVP